MLSAQCLFFAAARTTAVCAVVLALSAEIAQRRLETTPHPATDDETTTAEFPFLVGLIRRGKFAKNSSAPLCTGTLVSPAYVLSTAFCVSRLTAKIKAFRKTLSRGPDYRRVTNVYVHPGYNSATRLNDLSLSKIVKPFHGVNRFVRFSTETVEEDAEIRCVVVGVGKPHGHSYTVPVTVQYGSGACAIPGFIPGLNFIVGFTWDKFLCVKSVGDPPRHLSCEQSDALLCDDRALYGMHSYGYDTVESSRAKPVTDCGGKNVQNRHIFVNRHVRWITDTLSGNRLVVGAGDSGHEDRRRLPVVTPRGSVSYSSPIIPSGVVPTASSSLQQGTSSALEQSFSTPPPTLTETTAVVGKFDPEDYVYTVYLNGHVGEPECGGTLISPFHVLTTAYCTTRMTEIEVYLTSTTPVRKTNPFTVLVHPNFDASTLTADISVVVLLEPLNVNAYARLADAYSPPDGPETTLLLDCVTVQAKKRSFDYSCAPVTAKYGRGACPKSIDLEIQNAVSQTWREFACGIPGNRHVNGTGDPLICGGLQYGITSHSYRTLRATGTGADQVRFLALNEYYKRWIDDVVNTTTEICSAGTSANTCPRAAAAVQLFVVLQLCARYGTQTSRWKE